MLAVVVLSMGAGAAFANPSDLDIRFNSTGYMMDNYNPDNSSSRQNAPFLPIINADGSFVVFGQTSNGATATAFLQSFSANGVAQQPVLINDARPTIAAYSASDKIMLARSSVSVAGVNVPGYLKRLNRDGTLDSSFGNNGTVADPDMLLLGSEITLGEDAQGRIMVTSFSKGLMRFLANGALDASFGANGIAPLPADRAQFETFLAQAVATDGGYYVLTGGSGGDANSLLRYTSSGALDTAFGTGGRLKLLSNSVTNTIAAMPDGGVLALEGCKQGTSTCRLNHFSKTGSSVAMSARIRELPQGVTGQARLTRGALIQRLSDGRILMSADWVGTLSAPPWLATGQLFGMFNADLTPVTEFDGDNGLRVHNPGFEFNTTMPNRAALNVNADGSILYVAEATNSSFNPRVAAMRLKGGLTSTAPTPVPYVPTPDWPKPFSGVTPAANLAINVNTIGELVLETMSISSCVIIQSNGVQGSLEGIERFDIGFKILDMDQGIIQVVKTRPFNESGSLTASGALPDCSGIYEATTNRYTDFIQLGTQTFTVVFEVIDEPQLRLALRSAVETPTR
ncbi:MAG: hypothetical protein Q7L07_06710 [Pseudohongiella sp.]|nr:hypothetical protein [Pseudohongiella sp.]